MLRHYQKPSNQCQCNVFEPIRIFMSNNKILVQKNCLDYFYCNNSLHDDTLNKWELWLEKLGQLKKRFIFSVTYLILPMATNSA